MALTAVTLVGPVQSTASATSSSSVSSASSLVFINSGMTPFGYVNWDGITTTTTLTTYSNGYSQTYFTLNTAGGQVVNQLSYVGQGSAYGFPSTNPAGLSYSNWWQVFTSQSAGLTRTFRSDLVVGGVYSASFWHVQRSGYSTPTVFIVQIGGNTVWSTPPSSTSWFYVTTQRTTVTSSSASLTFSASCLATCSDFDMALSAVTLNGQMSLPVLPSVLNAGLLSCEYSTFDGYYTFGLNAGPGSSSGGIAALSAGTVLGQWTVIGYALMYNTGAGSAAAFGGTAHPYGGAYALWLQTNSGSSSGISRTFTNRVVGGSYMVSFWNMKRDSTQAPTSFVVTLGGTVVWNQVPTVGGYTWVQVASSAVVATTSSMTLSIVASSTDTNDRNMALSAVTLIGPARYLHFDGIVTLTSSPYYTRISMGNTTGNWFVTTSVGSQVISTTTGFFIFQPGTTPSSNSGFTMTSNPGTMGLTYAGWLQTGSTSPVVINRSFANAVVGGQYSLSFWFATRACGNTWSCLTPNSFTVALASAVVWSTLPTSASWQYCVTRNATAPQSYFSVAFNVRSTDSQDRNMAINAITIYQWPAASATRPAISNDGTKLFVGGGGQGLNDSNVYAVKSTTGAVMWQYNTGGAVKSSPALSTDGTSVYVGSDDTNMYALSSSTGILKWSVKTNGEVQSSPANTSTGLVVVPSLDGATYAIATPTTLNFSYTGSVQSFTVPFGVTSVQITMAGASGGGVGTFASGGLGGVVSTTIAVTAGTTYLVYVGGMGASSPGAGGFNGGGSGGITDGGGGGGASDIRTANDLATRIVVAGGGGGASSPPSTTCIDGMSSANGGNGGGASNIPTGADAPWLPCSSSWSPYTTAQGGSLVMGGYHGVDPWGVNSLTQSGAFGIGGSQMNLQSNKSSGGGGGGGYFGGGAGGFGPGAGGSSYCSAFLCSSTYFSVNSGASAANGYVTLTYILPNSAPNIITSFAGQGGISGYMGDGSSPLLASFSSNFGITFDVLGNLYVSDKSNQRVRKAVANMDGTMTMTTFAGNGGATYSGDNGQATSAALYNPSDVAVDATGSTVYISDSSNHRIRKVVVATGIITTYAGTGTAAYAGDGVAANTASLNLPDGLVVDNSG